MLTTYRVTTESGHNWTTNMAAGVTLEEATKYYMGRRINVRPFCFEPYFTERLEDVTKVEQIVEVSCDCEPCGCGD